MKTTDEATAALYDAQYSTKAVSDLPKSDSVDAMMLSSREKIKLKTLPVVLDTSQNGGSKPSCYREQRRSIVGVVHILAP